MSYFKNLATAWKTQLVNKRFKTHLAGAFIMIFLSFQINIYFLNVWQTRDGIVVNDQILNMLTPYDFSLPIFLVTYGGILVTIFRVILTPQKFIVLLYGYSLLTLCRTVSIYFLPLEPPAQMVFLNDPIASFILFQKHVVTKDLFFSGHTSSFFYCVFALDDKAHRQIGFAMAMVLGLMLMIQHVHYSIDIFAAPFFAYFCYKSATTYFKWDDEKNNIFSLS
jgi:hypothetical protein